MTLCYVSFSHPPLCVLISPSAMCYTEESEPEWFSEQICMTDTIELKGFDGHKEKTDKRDKKEREKKERKDPKNNKENTDKKVSCDTLQTQQRIHSKQSLTKLVKFQLNMFQDYHKIPLICQCLCVCRLFPAQ